MKNFGEYIKENITPFAQTEKGFVGVDNGPVRDNINMLLARATVMPFSTPYHALEAVRRIVASYHISIPQVKFLDGDAGHEIFMINQFGDKYGFNSDGKVVTKNTSPYHIYFEYAMNESGKFDVFSEVVTDEELEEILDDVEDELEDAGITAEKDEADATFDAYKADNADKVQSVSDGVEELEDRAHLEGNENAKDDALNEALSKKKDREKELAKGMKDEAGEHGMSKKEALKTAKDHLKKDPHYYTKLDKIGLGEATLGGKKYEGKPNPNNGKRKRTLKDLKLRIDRHSDKQSDAYIKWEASREGSKKQEKAGKEHDREADAVKAGSRILQAMKKKKKSLEEKSDPCWNGYEMVGMKKKGGRKVPNCVPKEK